MPDNTPAPLDSRTITELFVRLGLVALLVVISIQIFEPFEGLLLWSLILAVTLYPLQQRIARAIGNRQGGAATLVVVLMLLVIGVPILLLGSAFAAHVQTLRETLQSGGLTIKPPAPSVAEWPIVGEKVYQLWNAAATDLSGLLEKLQPQLDRFYKYLVFLTASTAGSTLRFIGSVIIAGIMMAYGEAGSATIERILKRLAGAEQGSRLAHLSTATIRSVALGVVGVALMQALILGIGFIWAGVPGAAVWALIVMLLGIAQLPALLVTLPVIGYIWWSSDATTMNIVYTLYLFIGGLADNVLKPLLLGRGVEAPMPVILLGALGGMVTAGMIGLFIGAVVLAVGYQIFTTWVAEADRPSETPG
jgi:predicted PurR-regulated permease PerM